MKLIVDTNRIIAALIKDGLARAIVSSKNIEFYTPDYVLDEVKKHFDYIIRKSGMTKENIELLFLLFMQNIRTILDKEIKVKIKEAIKIMKDIDINDAPILACALAMPNDGIWTEDKHFEQQNIIKVWKTKDLMRLI